MTCRHLFLLFLVVAGTLAPSAPRAQSAGSLVERVGDTGFLQLQAESFKQLDAKQQALAYWLTQASIAIDPIIYDQLSSTGLDIKRLLEEIVTHREGIPAEAFAKIRRYALLFWANRGNHNEITGQKFLPDFSREELKQAALQAFQNGGFRSGYGDLAALPRPEAVQGHLGIVDRAIFDASYEPTMTAKTPPPGKDIIQASSNTFYRGVTLEDLKNFREKYPLMSRVVKAPDGVLREDVY